MSRNGAYAGLGQPVRPPRRLAPVLPVLVVRVRRRADRDAAGEDVLQRPGVGAVRVHADRQVVHDAERHAGPEPGLPGPTASCSSSTHCSQQWKSTSSACVAGTRATAGEAGCRSSAGQSAKSGPCSSHSAHQVAKSSSPCPPGAGRPSKASSRPAVRGTAKMSSQRLPLRVPGAVAVDRGRRVELGQHLAPLGAATAARWSSSQLGVLRDPLHPQVERVCEAPGGGQVRRRLHRRHRLGRVQRVDQHEVGAVLGRRPDGQVLQVGQVADAPGLCATGRCRAGWRAPRPGDRPSGPGSPSQAGVTISGIGGLVIAGCAPAACGSPAAGRRESRSCASPDPAGRRSRAAGVQFSSCRRSRRLPPVSSSIQTSTGSPCGDVHPDRRRTAARGSPGSAAASGSRARRCVLGQRVPGRLRGRGVDSEPGQHRDHVSRRRPGRAGPASPSTRWRCRTPAASSPNACLCSSAAFSSATGPSWPGRASRASATSPRARPTDRRHRRSRDPGCRERSPVPREARAAGRTRPHPADGRRSSGIPGSGSAGSS